MLEKTCFAYREGKTPTGEVYPTCEALIDLYCSKYPSQCKFYQHRKNYLKKKKLANERLFKLGLKLKNYTTEGDEDNEEEV